MGVVRGQVFVCFVGGETRRVRTDAEEVLTVNGDGLFVISASDFLITGISVST